MLLLGIDLGTSSIKVSVVDADRQKCIASAQYPETGVDIISAQTGWAEQSPDLWWEHVKQAILKCHATKKYDPKDIAAIGIAYLTSSSKNAEQGTAITLSNNSFVYPIPPYSVVTFVEQ